MEHLKLFIKRLSCIIKGITDAGKGAFVSPEAEVKFPRRVHLGEDSILESRSRLIANGETASIKVGRYTTIYPYALLKANGGKIEIGTASAIHDYSVLYGNFGISIGDDVHIAAHVVMVAFEHDYEKLGSIDFSLHMTGRGIKIGNSVWIGANVVILDGLTIGDGSVIGAGAVVTEDIPPNSIAYGVPAKVVKKRK